VTGLPSILADPVPPRGSRDLSTVLWRHGRLSLVLEPRDLWLGLYVAHGAVYVCLVPCLPLRWERRRPDVPRQSQRVPDGSGRPGAWLPGRWK
jgi:hypothetical protein